jgi:hypothetical protein
MQTGFVAWMKRSVIREIAPALSCGLLLAALTSAVFADDMSDPMQPMYGGPTGALKAASGARWVVTGILISPERRLAMINDRLLEVGGKVDGARVKTIHGNGVELDINGRSVFLKHENASVRLTD